MFNLIIDPTFPDPINIIRIPTNAVILPSHLLDAVLFIIAVCTVVFLYGYWLSILYLRRKAPTFH